ncbi:hypothetical protein HanXRQr2_Chr01g0006211 [Helianthus annuus]|uniref:Uncharacterized protein n=1 Tax=Helianthus annuus TaxID=4232 RepID=A0A251VKN3_HELAN|nr:hypothetical protein HanXRQr2_Chr01g0006211 [Helianthus annuus]
MQVSQRYTIFRRTKLYIFLNHLATGFQQTQMVYEKLMLNLPVFTTIQGVRNMHEFS